MYLAIEIGNFGPYFNSENFRRRLLLLLNQALYLLNNIYVICAIVDTSLGLCKKGIFSVKEDERRF